MRRIITLVLLTFTLAATAQTTSELRFKYVQQNLGLSAADFQKLGPILKDYIKEMKDAGDIYDDVKDELKDRIKSDRLTDAQAARLTKARLKSEAKELEVKTAYYPKFRTVTTDRYIYKLYKLAADKKSKFVPNKKETDEDE